MVSLSDNDFSIFGLPLQFELDLTALSDAYLRLQRQTHPDRFVNANAHDKRLAIQWTARINEAYTRLRNPIERAVYWCELNGLSPREQQNNLPQALLIQQMQWHEALEESHHIDALKNLLHQILAEKEHHLAKIAQYIDDEHNALAAHNTVQALLFVDKFIIELTRKLEQREDAS